MDKPDTHFFELVMSLQGAAMVHMGQLKDPTGQITEPNLDMARHSIDTLSMLQRKMAGNLTNDESQMLEQILYSLRMAFLDASKQPEPDMSKSGEEAKDERAEKTKSENKTGRTEE